MFKKIVFIFILIELIFAVQYLFYFEDTNISNLNIQDELLVFHNSSNDNNESELLLKVFFILLNFL